jgi:hypothetical protein
MLPSYLYSPPTMVCVRMMTQRLAAPCAELAYTLLVETCSPFILQLEPHRLTPAIAPLSC